MGETLELGTASAVPAAGRPAEPPSGSALSVKSIEEWFDIKDRTGRCEDASGEGTAPNTGKRITLKGEIHITEREMRILSTNSRRRLC